MRGFMLFWLGQFVSILGTGMTQFVLTVWAWQTSGEVTALGLIVFFSLLPGILIGPLAGVLVDRWPRKAVLAGSDAFAAGITGVLWLLFALDQLAIWHLYLAAAAAGAAQAFQLPAMSASVALMVPARHLTRANALLGLAGSASLIIAPGLAGALLTVLSLGHIMLIDIVTFAFGTLTLLGIAIPRPPRHADHAAGQGRLHAALFGFRYVAARPGLLGLAALFFVFFASEGFGTPAIAPMILVRSDENELTLGLVRSLMAGGGLAGGLVLSLWGGPKRRIHGVLAGLGLASLGRICLGLGRDPRIWGVGAFAQSFFIPIVASSDEAIWQVRVAPEVQGRVFAARRVLLLLPYPLVLLVAGPLTDHVFEPAMRSDGLLGGAFGWLVGTGPGAGMALVIVLSGVVGGIVGLGGYLVRPIRRVDKDELPAHPAAAPPQAR